MIYIYDLLVNFNKETYSFYEWEETDVVEYLKKSMLLKISKYLYSFFITSNIIVDEEFLNLIKNKTEILEDKKIETLTYSVVLTDGDDAMAFVFASDGKIIEKSKFTIEDELELLEISKSIRTKKITYKELLNNEYSPSFITREGMKTIKLILLELESIKTDAKKINYLYYEWFNKKSAGNSSFDELVNDLKLFYYSDKHESFLKILNLMTIKE